MKYNSIIVYIVTLFLFAVNAKSSNLSFADTATIVAIPVSGDVDPGMATFIGRALNDAKKHHNLVILLEMDTFGGRVDAALQIVDSIINIPDTIQTIAFVKNKAISAGSLIALSCNKLYMKPNTTIGDCAPLTMAKDGPKMLGEKFQSPLRAKFRSLAKKNHYPQALAESMVTSKMTIYRVEFKDTCIFMDSIGYTNLTSNEKKIVVSKKVIVGNKELLTMDDVEAHNMKFSSGTVKNIDEICKDLGIKNFTIVNISETWSESMVRFIGHIAPALIIIGLAGIYIETKSPGFGIPGILGAVSLTIVFTSQYMAGLANYLEVALLLIGVLLLLAEIFIIPGFGIAGISGIITIAIGLVLSMQNFVLPKPEFPWQMDLFEHNIQLLVYSLLGTLIVIVIFFKYIFPNLSTAISGPNLTSTLKDVHTPSIDLSVGEIGKVIKPLRPTGSVIFNGLKYDVTSDNEYIDNDKIVKIIDIRGNVITVTEDKSNV